ncbi:MAG: PadR family transcriptional regulator [Ectothiorhodospiraceae bacterium]|nr:PadR family transcriptional regulator [Ectothiorhodospiraceae bacterium]MCH8504076.1 PadR family transcriptional regulator [Ectothiorhodospiraceae bacterium]
MDTKTLCLGALTFGDASGYEIKKCLEDSIGHFLEVSYAAIYPALADLHKQGLVHCQEVRQRTRPDKKMYRLTPAGRQAFAAALLQSQGRHKIRSEFLALVFFAEFLPASHLQRIVDERLTEFDQFVQLAEEWLAGEGLNAQPGARFAAGYGLAVFRAARDYVRENRHLLDEAATAVAAREA